MADGGHANEIIGASQEAGERGDKGDLAARSQPNRSSYHVLFCDEILYKSVRELLSELLGERGVLHVSVESHDEGIALAQRSQRGSEGLSCGNRVRRLVGGRSHRF